MKYDDDRRCQCGSSIDCHQCQTCWGCHDSGAHDHSLDDEYDD